MKVELLLATNNPHKVRELRAMLNARSFAVLSPADVGLELDVAETGKTFEDNARLKAEAFALRSGLLALADDSGLVVDALGGAPGVYSARYGGPDASDDDRNALVLAQLAGTPPARRGARFVAAIALAHPYLTTRIFRAQVDGFVSDSARGSNGFGYDPIFFYPPYARTFGEVSPEMKDAVSHRGKALREAVRFLETLPDGDILRGIDR